MNTLLLVDHYPVARSVMLTLKHMGCESELLPMQKVSVSDPIKVMETPPSRGSAPQPAELKADSGARFERVDGFLITDEGCEFITPPSRLPVFATTPLKSQLFKGKAWSRVVDLSDVSEQTLAKLLPHYGVHHLLHLSLTNGGRRAVGSIANVAVSRHEGARIEHLDHLSDETIQKLSGDHYCALVFRRADFAERFMTLARFYSLDFSDKTAFAISACVAANLDGFAQVLGMGQPSERDFFRYLSQWCLALPEPPALHSDCAPELPAFLSRTDIEEGEDPGEKSEWHVDTLRKISRCQRRT